MEEGGGTAEGINLEFTPTWVVAIVCSTIVFISLLVERSLHFAGKFLKKKNQKPLYEALLKIKEELMLLGFISLLLVVFQNLIQRICIPKSLMDNMLPCSRHGDEDKGEASTVGHVGSSLFFAGGRRLLSGGGSGAGYCTHKGKVPLLSLEALHQLHIFIFVLAVSHVTYSALTMILGSLRIHEWKAWEDAIQNEKQQSDEKKVTHLHQVDFIRERFKGLGKETFVYRWVHSFFKQFYGSVTRSDYTTMRLGFIMTHCRGNPKFNFHRYMMRALEADFKKVVGISWYLWVFVMIFLLLNVNGWHTYFWIAFIPLILLLSVGTKLEHVVTKLAHDVAEKHTAVQGDLVIKPTDEHFWFHRPRLVLYLIQFVLFQNAFEIAFFFWIWTTYGFDSCIMGQVRFIVPRLIIGVIIQVLCSYSTLPLYAIVTQMGSSFKKSIFDEHIQVGLVGWAKKAKKRKGRKATSSQQNSSNEKLDIEMQDVGEKHTLRATRDHDHTIDG